MPVSSDHKERIILHARERFFREGFAKISIEGLTADLSMSKKTFYQAFGSKDELIEEILQRKIGEVNSTMEHILSQSRDTVWKLHEIVRYMAGTLSTISKPLLVDIRQNMPHLWKRIEQFRRERLTKNITALLHQGMREGYIRKEVNSRVFLLAYLAAVESIIQADVLANESFSTTEAIQAIMDIFFQGILTESARIGLRDLQQYQSSTI